MTPTKDATSPQKSHQILRGTTVVGSFTLLSRILGFIRDLLFARLFGAGQVADAFFVAFRIPNLLRSVMAEGALTSGFIPVFSSELKRGKESAQRALSSVAGFLLIFTILISVLGIVYSDEVTNLFAPGFASDPEKFRLSSGLLKIMFPYIVFVSLVAMVGGALNSVKIFGTAAMAQVVMNLVFIGGLVVAMYNKDSAPYIIAWSVIIGGIAQLVYQVPALKRSGFGVFPSFRIFTPAVKQVSILMLPAIFGAAIYQLSVFFNTVFASFLREGSVSWLFYADRIAQLPIGIYSIALASVLLPALSHAHADDDEESFRLNLFNSLRYTSFLMIPVAAGIYVLSEPIIKIVFERGEFSSFAALQTSSALKAYALGLWGISCHTMIVRAFIARRDTVTPTLIGAIMLVLNVALSLALMGAPVAEGNIFGELIISLQRSIAAIFPLPSFGHVGLAVASSVSSTVGFVLLGYVLKRHKILLPWSKLFYLVIKVLIASALGGMSAYAVMAILLDTFDASSQFLYLDIMVWATLGGVMIGAVVFGGAALLLKISEMRETLQILKRLYRRKA